MANYFDQFDAVPNLTPNQQSQLYRQPQRDIRSLSDAELNAASKGTKIVEFEGDKFHFPADTTDAEIATALDNWSKERSRFRAGPGEFDVQPRKPVTDPALLAQLNGKDDWSQYPRVPDGFVLDKPANGSIAGGLSKQALAGLATGAEAISASVPSILGLAGGALENAAPGLSDPEALARRNELKALIDKNRNGGIAQYFPEPQGQAETYTRAATHFIPAMLGLGGTVKRAAGVGAAAGVGSEAAGQFAESANLSPVDQGVARVGGALLGGGVAGAVRGGVAESLAPGRARPKLTTAEDVAKAADQGYADARASGWEGKPAAFHGAAGKIKNEALGDFDADLAPKTFGLLDKTQARFAPTSSDAMRALTGGKPEAAPVTIKELDTLRRKLGQVAQGSDATDGAAAKIAQRALDDFLENVTPAQTLKGDPQALAATIKDARGNYAASMRHEAFANVIERATDQAASAGSGANLQNSLRRETKSFIRPDARGASPASKAGFNQAEIEQLRRFVRGGGGNVNRIVGNMLGGGGGIGTFLTSIGGASLLGPAGAALPAVGAAVKNVGNKLAERRAQALLDVILSRSPVALQAGERAAAAPRLTSRRLDKPTPALIAAQDDNRPRLRSAR